MTPAPIQPTHVAHLDEMTRGFRASLDAISFPTTPVDKADLEASMLRAMELPSLAAINLAVRQAIKTVHHETLLCVNPTQWKSCSGECDSIVRALMTAELASTAYMLRALAASVLSVEKAYTLEFATTEPLTGLWEIDCEVVRIVRLGDPVPGRLMMGFGPSASGKTYWAKSLLTLCTSADPTFPKTLLTIDGGTYRAVSVVYKAVVEEAARICALGFDNLVLSTWSPTRTSLFSSDIVKKSIITFLRQQRIPISLYVPETLGDCGHFRPKNCNSKYASYIAITHDAHWIGLLIWQHINGAACDQEGVMRCVGCTESGQKREVEEGKKYSNSAYEHSMQEGEKEFRMAPGGQYKIHNGGGPGRISTFQDFTIYTEATQPIQAALANAESKYSYVYKLM
jgi:hypothetical protein